MYLLGTKYNILLNTLLIEREKSFILIIFFSSSFLFPFLFRCFIIQIFRIEAISAGNLKIV